MSLQMSLWEVNGKALKACPVEVLDDEMRLEDWIENDTSLLGMELLLIGRQVQTRYRGYLDLLGIDSEGNLIVLELKKDKTPREVVAQILDYASWAKELSPAEVGALAAKYLKRSLSEAFAERFGSPIPTAINVSHRLIIVASKLDDSSERIVQYLASEHSLDINVVFFNCFTVNGKEVVGRSWLMDPEEVEQRSEARHKLPWSGTWFVNVGERPFRNWDDFRKYGFTSAGQGAVYSRPLIKLEVGDKIFAYLKGYGYVGYGEITSTACMAKDFMVDGKRLLDLPLVAPSMNSNSDDPELSEWVVGVKWLCSFPREESKTFTGVFANQNVVCKLRHEQTLDFLKREFGLDEAVTTS
ncbi:hypothetical protein ETAA8_08980 [Anatilimnocola aggregata]|uniref:Endonuclease NucS C-terminal domain-containing protein n=1 Tax=Anatilimnocola aggregata TaxID=2528021 RepID=A0A517Y6I5_9BACT|nr:endonuclease NucS domain-containing protein [Anatilimnocola aggregata]QDU25826.1 hypothetical protein ETAA8_08980 [Anatilimnocola aggregata]